MAEALIVVGAIASAVQITDCVCRLTKVLHGKYETFSSTEENILRLKGMIEDFDLVARNLRLYQAEHASSVAANVEHEVLPAIVTKLKGCQVELELLGAIIDAAKPTTSSGGRVNKIGRRIRWVYDEKKTSASLLRLEQHKATVMIALQTIGLRNDIKLRQGINDLRSDTLVQAQNFAFNIEQSTRSVDALRDAVNRSDEQQTKTLAELCTSYDGHARQFLAYSNNSLAHQEKQLDLLQQVPVTANKVANLASEFARFTMSNDSFRAETRASTLSADAFVRLFRQQFLFVLPEMKEQFISQMRTEYKGWVREEFDQLSKAFAEVMRETVQHYGTTPGLTDPSHSRDHDFSFPDDFIDNQDQLGRSSGGGKVIDTSQNSQSRFKDSVPHDGPTRYSKLRADCKIWSFKWRFGTLRVSITRSSTACREIKHESRVFEANIEFLPASWLFQRGLSLSYTSSTDLRGYIQRCPDITTFAVIPKKTGPFKCIFDGRIEDLREMFDKRLAAPSDRDENDRTLLVYAIMCGVTDICRCLLAVGADPEIIGGGGFNALQILIFRLIGLSIRGTLNKERTEAYSGMYRMLELRTGEAAIRNDPEMYQLADFWDLPVRQEDERTSFDPSSFVSEGMQFLKDIGYDFNALDTYGWAPLLCTAQVNNPTSIGLLLMYGGDPNIRSSTGMNALHMLVYGLHTSTNYRHFTSSLKLLIRAGCDILATTSDGYTPSVLAWIFDAIAYKGFTDRFKLWTQALAECGIDIKDVLAAESEERAESSAVDRGSPGQGTLRQRTRPIKDTGEEGLDTVSNSNSKKRRFSN
ncbi:MAG: hypothetical protein M1812_006725 [Candelaria pacifica]|nr:MAG: hypothetical protein M1812_006725 [Candelaria pacifica]